MQCRLDTCVVSEWNFESITYELTDGLTDGWTGVGARVVRFPIPLLGSWGTWLVLEMLAHLKTKKWVFFVFPKITEHSDLVAHTWVPPCESSFPDDSVPKGTWDLQLSNDVHHGVNVVELGQIDDFVPTPWEQRCQKRQTLQTFLCFFFQLVLIFGKATRKTMQALGLTASLGSSFSTINDVITHKIGTTARHYQCYQHQCY